MSAPSTDWTKDRAWYLPALRRVFMHGLKVTVRGCYVFESREQAIGMPSVDGSDENMCRSGTYVHP